MSRKDFIAIAETILNLDLVYVQEDELTWYSGQEDTNGSQRAQRTMIAEEFADMLEQTNPAFNRQLFIQAATGVVPVTARKAI